MPKWVTGYQISVTDPGLASTSNISDSNNATFESVAGTAATVSITTIWNLGPSPQQVTGYDLLFAIKDSLTVVFEYSNNGSSWTAISLAPGFLAPCIESDSSYGVTGLTITARYWRLSVKDTSTGCATQVAKVKEFRLTKSGGGLPTEDWITPSRRRVGMIL